ncbi:MAG: hypothetical protein ACLFPQ_02915 [Candidatus Woesearchaeota archaeon]
MADSNLESFIKRELGNKGIKTLNSILIALNLENIEEASDDQKKRFVAEIVPEFREKSLARSKVLTSELRSILGLEEDVLDLDDTGKEVEKQMIRSFVNVDANDKLRSTLSKIEAVFNLFWSKAGEAFDMGVSIKDIHRISRQVLKDIKSDIIGICDNIENLLGMGYGNNSAVLAKSLKKKYNSKFSFTDVGGVLEDKKETPLESAINEFREKVMELFDEFEKIFLESIDEDLIYRHRNQDDTDLVEITKEKTNHIWDEIVDAYEIMKQKIDKIEKIE